MAYIYATFSSDVIDAQDGVTNDRDIIYGFDGNDVIYGLGGNDYIEGGAGADYINGGSGYDTASYYNSAAVFVSLASGSGVGGDANGDTLVGIENLEGSYYDDLLAGDDVNNVLDGRNGRDILKGGGGGDLLYGGEGNDTLYGGSGGDTLNGGNGSDDLFGGTGDDIYVVDSEDRISEAAGEGTDIVYSYAIAYTLSDNIEILSLASPGSAGIYGTGNAQANTIFGNAGNNVLNGGAGSDSLSGLGGNDTFVFRAGQANGDVVYEFNGNGAAAGDVLRFEGYGTLAQGATFHQITSTIWQVTSANGAISELITLTAGAVIDTTTDLVFV